MVWVGHEPLGIGKQPVKAFESGLVPLTGPSKSSSIKVDLQLGGVDERSKATHAAPIQAVVVLVSRHIYHVEITTQQPRTSDRGPEL